MGWLPEGAHSPEFVMWLLMGFNGLLAAWLGLVCRIVTAAAKTLADVVERVARLEGKMEAYHGGDD